MGSRQYAPNVHVPSAVVERAALDDMIYAACPRCFASMNAVMDPAQAGMGRGSVICPTCGVESTADAVSFKYRLKLQLIDGSSILDTILFNEPVEALMGVPASSLHKLVREYPSLPWLLEDLLVGLHVSFTYQPAENRHSSQHKYNRDLKVLSIRPLARVLLPKPLVTTAMAMLSQVDQAGLRHDR